MDTDLLLSMHFAIYSPFCGLSFIFKIFFAVQKFYIVLKSNSFDLYFVTHTFVALSNKTPANQRSKDLLFKCFILSYIFCTKWERDLISLFCTWISCLPSTTLHDYCSFMASLEFRKYQASILFFSFKKNFILAIFGSLLLLWISGSVFQFLKRKKKNWDFGRGCNESRP